MLKRWKRRVLAALGYDPDPVVVTLWSGPEDLCARMQAEVESLLPQYRHVPVSAGDVAGEPPGDGAGCSAARLRDESAVTLALRIRSKLPGKRLGMVAVMFGAGEQGEALRQAAFLLAPGRVLAFNPKLERLHLRVSDALTAYLFLAGVPLDAARARPAWWPAPHRKTHAPDEVMVVKGRPAARARATVAVLTPFTPWPLTHGGAVRMFHLLREAAVEFDIHLFSFLEPGETPVEGPLEESCRRVTYVRKPQYHEPRWTTIAPAETREYRSPAMDRELERFRREHPGSPVQVEFTQLAGYRGDVLVEHDITFDLYRQIHERTPGPGAWWNWWRWRRFERQALSRFPHVVAMSHKDEERAGRRCAVIPNGVDLKRFAFVPEQPGANVLFVGSLRHFPNAAAFRFLWDEVWPRVRQQCPGVRLTVVAGPQAQTHWQSFTGQGALPEGPGLELHEFVADVAPLYRSSNLVVVPTLFSAGTNLKALEAMAAGRAMVSTPSGVDGLGLANGESVVIASGAAEFAGAVAALLEDPARRQALARAAMTHARLHFGWAPLGMRQRDLWRGLAGSPLRIRGLEESDAGAVNSIQSSAQEAAQWDLSGYPRETTWIAEVAGEVAGFIAVRAVAADEHEVLNLAVAVEWRRQGVARRLLEHAMRVLPGEWFLEVRESNGAARKLYEGMGFEAVGRRRAYYRDPEEDALILKYC